MMMMTLCFLNLFLFWYSNWVTKILSLCVYFINYSKLVPAFAALFRLWHYALATALLMMTTIHTFMCMTHRERFKKCYHKDKEEEECLINGRAYCNILYIHQRVVEYANFCSQFFLNECEKIILARVMPLIINYLIGEAIKIKFRTRNRDLWDIQIII